MSVVILGSLNTDLCYQVKELPRAGETISALNFEVFNGGKGANQAVAAARSGADTVMIGTIGQDNYGQDHIDSMEKDGINTSYINHDSLPTGTANIYIDQHGENNIVLNAGANGVTNATQLNKFPLSSEDILVVQMEINHQHIAHALQLGKSHSARTILNLAPAPDIFVEGLLDNVDYLVVNEIEAERVYQHINSASNNNALNIKDCAKEIAATLNTHCIVTLGGEGVYAADKTGAEYSAQPLNLRAEQIIDTTGAGDAFTGAFASALHKGHSFDSAIKYAAIAGSLACLKLGAQSSYPYAADIEKYLKPQPAQPADDSAPKSISP